MADQAATRRIRLLEELREHDGKELSYFARLLGVDERTIRRDIDYLHDLLTTVHGIELRRSLVYARRSGFAPGYFTDQLEQDRAAKQAIARAIVDSLCENLALVLTAGSTTYYVAREIRRTTIEEGRPNNLIAFTNSLPALLEFIAAGLSTGMIGEVYNPDDCAFYSSESHSAFQPGVAIVGASGLVAHPASGTLDLFCHRAEEAAFLKQMLAPIPEIVVAVGAEKIGRRHPWSFTSGILAGKTVRIFTGSLSDTQRDMLDRLTATAPRTGCALSYHQTGN